jgi:tetratricopeptide (TPR) repeat protein
MVEFRKELLDKAKAFYSHLIPQDPKSEQLAREAALGHNRLGDINRLLFLGDGAIKEYKEALAEFEVLARKHPANADYRRMLAYDHHWIAETLRIWLQSEQKPSHYTSADAEREYNLALDIQQALHTEAPTNHLYQQELARTYYNRGILRYYSQQFDSTEKDFRQAIALLEPLTSAQISLSAEKNQSQPTPSQDLARVYNDLGNLLSKRKEYPEAAKVIEQAIAIHNSLLEKDPSNREYKQELAVFYNNLSAARYNNGQFTLAESANHSAFDLIEDLITPNPSLGDARARANQARDLILEQESRMIGTAGNTKQISHHPEFHVMNMNLGRGYARLAQQYLIFDDLQDAENAIESIHRILLKLAPQDQVELSASYKQLKKELSDKKQKHE